MKQKKPKQKSSWQQWLMMGLFMLIGACCGLLMIRYMEMTANTASSPAKDLLIFGALFLAMYAGMLLQIILHEAGHLVFGLLTGYRFSSFRIFSLMLIKEEGKLKCKRFSLAGTGGQCLMCPPQPAADGSFPYVLYNLGGSLMNLASSLLFFLLTLAMWQRPLASTLLLMLVVIGVAFALINGLPLRLTATDNDGRNILSIGQDPAARRAFWLQLAIHEQVSRNVPITEMPEEWFALPDEAAMQNSMCATIAVFAANRLMALGERAEADALMAHLLQMDSGIIGIQRCLLICDRITCEVLGENRKEIIDAMLTRDQQKFMKSMKTYPTVLRTRYILALLHENDQAKAKKLLQQFEKTARSYPYPADIQPDRDLLAAAQHKLA